MLRQGSLDDSRARLDVVGSWHRVDRSQSGLDEPPILGAMVVSPVFAAVLHAPAALHSGSQAKQAAHRISIGDVAAIRLGARRPNGRTQCFHRQSKRSTGMQQHAAISATPVASSGLTTRKDRLWTWHHSAASRNGNGTSALLHTASIKRRTARASQSI
jgi:hypothetical protein